jgi:hypothetical protein
MQQRLFHIMPQLVDQRTDAVPLDHISRATNKLEEAYLPMWVYYTPTSSTLDFKHAGWS